MEHLANVALSTQELKRLAIQIAAQLPPDEAEALSILDYVRKLVVEFLADTAKLV